MKMEGELKHVNDGPAMGWGMHLVDGIDYFRFGLAGLFGLLASMMAGVLYTKLHHDMQGGMAVASCLALMVTYLATIVGLAESQA